MNKTRYELPKSDRETVEHIKANAPEIFVSNDYENYKGEIVFDCVVPTNSGDEAMIVLSTHPISRTDL